MGDTTAQQNANLGTWGNMYRAITTTYTVALLDKGWTVSAGGAASYTISLTAASGYDQNFQVVIVNADTANNKTVAPNGLSSFTLRPGQSCLVFNNNSVWRTSFITTSLIPGTSTNDNAPAGYIGEYIESVVALGSAVALSNNITTNLTSMSLTAGDWDVTSQMYFLPAATTTVTICVNSISATSATLDTSSGSFGEVAYVTTGTVIGANNINSNAGPKRISLAATTTIFHVAFSSFGTSTMAVYGIIRARRMR